jgi:hypothetical protein
MFSQVVRGHANDPAAVRRVLKLWAPTAGTSDITAGVTDDGRFIAVTSFESEESARAAHGDWHGVLDGQVSLRSGTRTHLFAPGERSCARFVQVVQGQVTDLVEACRHLDSLQQALAARLPCLLGTMTVEHDDERFTRVLYFSTEEEARAGERDVPAEARHRDEPARRLLVGPPEFLDLRDPWLQLAPQTSSDPVQRPAQSHPHA